MTNIEHLIKFISENKDWQEKLSAKPYSLRIRQQDNLYIFSYNMIDSDFTIPLVKAARGTILHIDDHQIKCVCHAFDKFHNYGESQADIIDWNTARVLEKIDGSLIKCFYYEDKWQFATNNGFDANANIQSEIILNVKNGPEKHDSFQDLIDFAIRNITIDWDNLDRNYTFMFELVGPYNRVVIPYEKTKLFLLGARNIVSGKEVTPEQANKFFNNQFSTPAVLDITDIKTAITTSESLDAKHEGFVVVDNNFNRIKIKGPAYLACHHLKDDRGQFTYKSLFQCIKDKTQDDVKSYFTETIPYFERIEKVWKNLSDNITKTLSLLEESWKDISSQPPFDQQKKKYAAVVLPEYKWISSAAFELCKKKTIDEVKDEWLNKMDYDKFVEITNFKER